MVPQGHSRSSFLFTDQLDVDLRLLCIGAPVRLIHASLECQKGGRRSSSIRELNGMWRVPSISPMKSRVFMCTSVSWSPASFQRLPSASTGNRRPRPRTDPDGYISIEKVRQRQWPLTGAAANSPSRPRAASGDCSPERPLDRGRSISCVERRLCSGTCHSPYDGELTLLAEGSHSGSSHNAVVRGHAVTYPRGA